MLNPKILVIGYLPPPYEGTARITEIIIHSQKLKKNFELKFLHLLKRKSGNQRGKFSLVNIIYNVVNFLNYCGLIIYFRPDVIYMPLAQNRFGFLRDSLFIFAGKVFRTKISIHFHGGNFDLFFKHQIYIFKIYILFILKHIDQLILLANKFKSQFPIINSDKIISIYNCIPEVSLISAKKEYKFIKEKITRVLFIGYISKAKGALDLVKSIPHVLASYRDPIEFILCGQPIDIEHNIMFIPEPHFGHLRSKEFIARNNLGSYVRISPEIQGIEKEKMFLEADIFVLPSYSEGCALTVLEAMAFGLPVITTSVGALEEMLNEGENCFFVRPGNIIDISKKILFLLNNPVLCQKMGEANRRLVKDKYNSDIFLNNIADAWNSVLKDK